MKKDLLIAGFGGQGILLMGRLLAEAAMHDGYHATWFPSYGPEMRGGTANCTTIFADEEIGSPISAAYDVVIAMNEPSLDRFTPMVRPGGALLVNTSMAPARCLRDDLRAIHIPTMAIAARLGVERVANVVMLGAVMAVCPAPKPSAYERAVEEVIGHKRIELVAVNVAALAAGRQEAERQIMESVYAVA